MFSRRIAAGAFGALLLTHPLIASGCALGARSGYEERLASWRAQADVIRPIRSPADDAEGAALFEGHAALQQSALVTAVLSRSPTLTSAQAAWRAALEDVPQAIALEDPMLAYEIAPLSLPLPGAGTSLIGGDAHFGNSIMLSQRLPFPGKLEARGALALSSADVAEQELKAARLSLGLLASQLWADYFAVSRSLAVNDELSVVLAALRESAEAHLETGHSLLRDPLKAEVALAHLEHDRVVLQSRRRVLVARLNGLLHRPPRAPLPPPPNEVALPDVVESDDDFMRRALEQRPELAAAEAGIRNAEAGLDLASLAYAPDMSVSGEYTSMFPMLEHQWMVGASLSLPLQFDRRQAEHDAAEARVLRAESERARVVDELRTELAVARERVAEAHHVVALFERRLLPAARGQLEAARASLEAGTRGFFDVLEAEEDLRRIRLSREEAIADLLKRSAELERALGRIPGLAEDTSTGTSVTLGGEQS